jgi:porphobilinogen deaminase
MKRADLRALVDQIVAERVEGHHPSEFEAQLRKAERFVVSSAGCNCRVAVAAHLDKSEDLWVVVWADDGTAKGFHKPVMRAVNLGLPEGRPPRDG